MNAVDDLDATIKGCRTAAWTLTLGSLVLVAALRMSRVPWNFGGGPVSIRLRSPGHHA
jgi:hypothetical protein